MAKLRNYSLEELPSELLRQGGRILLHGCCAPCSTAIVEWMVENGLRPTLFFSNSNIHPFSEYAARRDELIRFASPYGLEVVEDDYDHSSWLAAVKGLEREPERGRRCLECFRFRLRRAAGYAAASGFGVLATTLASSRWKDLEQVNQAGAAVCREVSSQMSGGAVLSACGDDNAQKLSDQVLSASGDDNAQKLSDQVLSASEDDNAQKLSDQVLSASEDDNAQVHSGAALPTCRDAVLSASGDVRLGEENAVPGGESRAVSDTDGVLWLGQNWRKGGLQERRNALIRELGLYNQTFCGCEFSSRQICAKSHLIDLNQ